LQHRITFEGPAAAADEFVNALAEEDIEVDLVPLFGERRTGERIDALSITAWGGLDEIERVCRRFVRIGPAVLLTINGERVAPDGGPTA
jgi:hypothetical protein